MLEIFRKNIFFFDCPLISWVSKVGFLWLLLCANLFFFFSISFISRLLIPWLSLPPPSHPLSFLYLNFIVSFLFLQHSSWIKLTNNYLVPWSKKSRKNICHDMQKGLYFKNYFTMMKKKRSRRCNGVLSSLFFFIEMVEVDNKVMIYFINGWIKVLSLSSDLKKKIT